MRETKHLVAVAAAAVILAVAGTASKAASVFTLKSTTFEDGKIMPKRVANSKANQPNNPNCVGDNVSPQFSWSNVPEGTKSFVLTMFDPEGRAPAGVSHWVAYGIPASVSGFAEGETSKASDNYVGGKSTMGVGNYSGPCTPPNTTPHHYTFVLVAADFDPKELPPGLTRDEVIAKVRASACTFERLDRNGGFICEPLARVMTLCMLRGNNFARGGHEGKWPAETGLAG